MAAEELSITMDIVTACQAVAIPRATFYRRRGRRQHPVPIRLIRKSARALEPAERKRVLEVLHSELFVDQSPAEVSATLLDQGILLCSERTMYRILEAEKEVRERRAQRTHPAYKKPELLAVGPNQVWSWDITELRGPLKWERYYLYVILDIFSRYSPGWMIAERQTADMAEHFIAETISKHDIKPGQLIIHQDNGSPMVAKSVVQLYTELGIEPSYSRPHVSDDNPFSEAHFKTAKYRPGFPDRFGSIEDAILHFREFFRWYHTEHHHSGIAYLTPEIVHFGRAREVLRSRQATLDAAYLVHPERYVSGSPKVKDLPSAVWINPPMQRGTIQVPEVFTQISLAAAATPTQFDTQDLVLSACRADPQGKTNCTHAVPVVERSAPTGTSTQAIRENHDAQPAAVAIIPNKKARTAPTANLAH